MRYSCVPFALPHFGMPLKQGHFEGDFGSVPDLSVKKISLTFMLDQINFQGFFAFDGIISAILYLARKHEIINPRNDIRFVRSFSCFFMVTFQGANVKH
jgi:hypothetical protein